MVRLPLLALTLALLLAVPAGAMVKLPAVLPTVAHNPADRMLGVPIEDSVYDPATKCTPKAPRPGVEAMTRWLEANARGVFWGSYRCEKWGKHSASLHAENRAVDWHLDVRDPADRHAAEKLVRMLLAPDAAGNPQALARRMGVEEMIWDCGYWGAGMTEFNPYDPCYKRGRPRKKVNVTIAHRDHIHFGLTKAAAKAQTSFWSRRR